MDLEVEDSEVRGSSKGAFSLSQVLASRLSGTMVSLQSNSESSPERGCEKGKLLVRAWSGCFRVHFNV